MKHYLKIKDDVIVEPWKELLVQFQDFIKQSNNNVK